MNDKEGSGTMGSEFKDKVAVITGGSGVLCSVMAKALGVRGAKVVIVGHSRLERAQKVASDIVAAGGQAIAAEANVISKDSLQDLADMVLETYGRIDILINGAGGARKDATTSKDLSFFDLPEDAVRWVFDLNFFGTFFACQVFGRLMMEQDSGNILNFSSMGALKPLTRSVAYSAGKAAVTNFTQWLAVHMSQEYSPRIRVNALMPGFFLTEQNRFLVTDAATGEWTPRGQRIIDHTPMGRFGTPDDLVGPALWLLSDAAQFVHGTAVIVDGGISAYGGV